MSQMRRPIQPLGLRGYALPGTLHQAGYRATAGSGRHLPEVLGAATPRRAITELDWRDSRLAVQATVKKMWSQLSSTGQRSETTQSRCRFHRGEATNRVPSESPHSDPGFSRVRKSGTTRQNGYTFLSWRNGNRVGHQQRFPSKTSQLRSAIKGLHWQGVPAKSQVVSLISRRAAGFRLRPPECWVCLPFGHRACLRGQSQPHSGFW